MVGKSSPLEIGLDMGKLLKGFWGQDSGEIFRGIFWGDSWLVYTEEKNKVLGSAVNGSVRL